MIEVKGSREGAGEGTKKECQLVRGKKLMWLLWLLLMSPSLLEDARKVRGGGAFRIQEGQYTPAAVRGDAMFGWVGCATSYTEVRSGQVRSGQVGK